MTNNMTALHETAKVAELNLWQHPAIELRGTNENGDLIALVPTELIYNDEAAVGEKHIGQLAKEIQDEAEQTGGSGQIMPLLIAETPSMPGVFQIADGFHRYTILKKRGAQIISALIRPNCSDDQLDRLRIVSATMHEDVQYPRVLRSVSDAWKRTDWAKRGITPGLAFMIGIGKQSGLILPKEDAQGITAWVQEKCDSWSLKPNTLYRKITDAQGVSPTIIDQVRVQRPGGPYVLTQRHIKQIGLYLSHRFDIQETVSETAKKLELTPEEVGFLAAAVAGARDVGHAAAISDNGAWRIKARKAASAKSVAAKQSPANQQPAAPPPAPAPRPNPVAPADRANFAPRNGLIEDALIIARLSIANALYAKSITKRDVPGFAFGTGLDLDRANSILFDENTTRYINTALTNATAEMRRIKTLRIIYELPDDVIGKILNISPAQMTALHKH